MSKEIWECADPQQPGRMSGEDFLELWCNKWLRQYLVDAARSMARKNDELFKDLLQEAWLRIDQNQAGLKIEYYAQEGFRAMDCYYRAEIRRWRLTRRRWSEDPAYRRVRKVTKRFFRKRSQKA